MSTPGRQLPYAKFPKSSHLRTRLDFRERQHWPKTGHLIVYKRAYARARCQRAIADNAKQQIGVMSTKGNGGRSSWVAGAAREVKPSRQGGH